MAGRWQSEIWRRRLHKFSPLTQQTSNTCVRDVSHLNDVIQFASDSLIDRFIHMCITCRLTWRRSCVISFNGIRKVLNAAAI